MIRKPTPKDFKKAQEICSIFRVNVYFGYTGDGCEADVDFRNIMIDLKNVLSTNIFWSAVFHELGHIWCWDNKKYYKYHADSLSDKEMAKYVRKYGLKIERYVDSVGKKLSKESGIKFRYCPSHKHKSDIEWFNKWIEREYPL